MTHRIEVERDQFFLGWPEPEPGYRCFCRPDGDYGPVDIMITMADGREFFARMSAAMRSPYSPDVLQVYFDTIHHWADGVAMTAAERRQVARIICSGYESQLYADEQDLQAVPGI